MNDRFCLLVFPQLLACYEAKGIVILIYRWKNKGYSCYFVEPLLK